MSIRITSFKEEKTLTISEGERLIREECQRIEEWLVTKNRKYGNAALEPIGVFCNLDSVERINARLDEKLNRIKNRQDDEDEDPEDDLVGWLILKRIAARKAKTKKFVTENPL